MDELLETIKFHVDPKKHKSFSESFSLFVTASHFTLRQFLSFSCDPVKHYLKLKRPNSVETFVPNSFRFRFGEFDRLSDIVHLNNNDIMFPCSANCNELTSWFAFGKSNQGHFNIRSYKSRVMYHDCIISIFILSGSKFYTLTSCNGAKSTTGVLCVPLLIFYSVVKVWHRRSMKYFQISHPDYLLLLYCNWVPGQLYQHLLK